MSKSKSTKSTICTRHFRTLKRRFAWQVQGIMHLCQLRELRMSRSVVLFLMLSSSKIEEISQNSFAFDVVKFKSWGSLAELLRF